MNNNSDSLEKRRIDLVQRYLQLTREVLPELARTERVEWPVQNDHCFQRIVLDTVSNGVWYDHIRRPAYVHLSMDQAWQAVQMCEDIVAGSTDLAELNRKSLLWRSNFKNDSSQ